MTQQSPLLFVPANTIDYFEADFLKALGGDQRFCTNLSRFELEQQIKSFLEPEFVVVDNGNILTCIKQSVCEMKLKLVETKGITSIDFVYWGGPDRDFQQEIFNSLKKRFSDETKINEFDVVPNPDKTLDNIDVLERMVEYVKSQVTPESLKEWNDMQKIHEIPYKRQRET